MNKPGIMNRRIPTLLGLFVLIGGLVLGILAVNKRTNFSPKAGPTESPKNVKLTNKSASGISISWTTDTPMTGYIKYSEDPAKINLPAGDTRDQISGTSQSYTNHYSNLTGLGPNKTYYFVIGSGSQTYNDNGKPFQIRTWSQASTPPEDIVSGKIMTADGSPVNGGIVFLEVEGGETLSTISKNDGTWRVNIANSRDKAGKVLTYDSKISLVSIFVQAGTQGSATATTNTEKSKPVPDIIMGKNQSFVEGEGILNSLSGLENNSASRSATFAVAEGSLSEVLTQNSGPIKLFYPAIEGELVATTSPEFRGELTVNSTLNIKVGELNATASSGTDGKWSWSPVIPLLKGAQQIELSFKDASNSAFSLKRNFVIVSAGDIGGLPAFTATPSATPEITPTPTETTTMPVTENPELEKSGAVELTMGSIFFGLLLLLTGGYLKKKWNN